METIAASEKKRALLNLIADEFSGGKYRRFIGTALAAGLLAIGVDAQARPEPIPKPVDKPEPGESPGTGQKLPDDPEEPPPLGDPLGRDCTEGEDQSNCDPDHPDGKPPSNTPGPAWYDDMHQRMYDLQESLDDMIEWAEGEDDPDIEAMCYYATLMQALVQQYYALAYDSSGEPRQYPFGKMTRGDYNYFFYYWVRPIYYYGLLYYAVRYYEENQDEGALKSQNDEYLEHLDHVVQAYHPVVLCNYGFKGDDKGAREDLDAQAAEERAGVR